MGCGVSSTSGATVGSDGKTTKSMQSGGDVVWYFAIGSMMNPISMSARKLAPIESKAAECLDYKL